MTEESIKPPRSVARKLAGLWPLLTEEEQARVEAAMEVKHYKKTISSMPKAKVPTICWRCSLVR